jgi:hypothetical protein
MRTRIAIIGALLATTACGTTQNAQEPPKVATLASPDAAPSSASPVPAQDRPRFRLDMTDQERQDMYRPYLKCMTDHGVQVLAGRTGSAPKPDKATMDNAATACDPLLPLPPWEEDATNPAAMDFAKKVVDCLRAKGVKKVEVSDDNGIVGPSFGGPGNDQESITKGMDLTPACEKEVAGVR